MDIIIHKMVIGQTIEGEEYYEALYRKDYVIFARNVDYGIENRVSQIYIYRKTLSFKSSGKWYRSNIGDMVETR